MKKGLFALIWVLVVPMVLSAQTIYRIKDGVKSIVKTSVAPKASAKPTETQFAMTSASENRFSGFIRKEDNGQLIFWFHPESGVTHKVCVSVFDGGFCTPPWTISDDNFNPDETWGMSIPQVPDISSEYVVAFDIRDGQPVGSAYALVGMDNQPDTLVTAFEDIRSVPATPVASESSETTIHIIGNFSRQEPSRIFVEFDELSSMAKILPGQLPNETIIVLDRETTHKLEVRSFYYLTIYQWGRCETVKVLRPSGGGKG